MGQPRPLFCLFSVFSNKHYKFLQQIYVKKIPSNIRCRDSNPRRPSECESFPITTRPGLQESCCLNIEHKMEKTELIGKTVLLIQIDFLSLSLSLEDQGEREIYMNV